MIDVVEIIKKVIRNNKKLKKRLIAEGAVEERDGDIVILSDKVMKWKEVDKR